MLLSHGSVFLNRAAPVVGSSVETLCFAGCLRTANNPPKFCSLDVQTHAHLRFVIFPETRVAKPKINWLRVQLTSLPLRAPCR